MEMKVDGIIVSNTTVSRPSLKSSNAGEEGGLSGDPLYELSTRRLALMFRLTGGKMPLIGVGGIDSATRAWEKLRAGASLIQIYTALVYEGPGLVPRIVDGLAARLRQSRASSIASVVGSGVSEWL
jgi:dihydroorotate dehydrogenase